VTIPITVRIQGESEVRNPDLLDYGTSYQRILIKFYGELRCGLETNWLHLGDDPHHYPDPGVRSGSRSGSGIQQNNSIMLAFGGGLCSLSTSSSDVGRFTNHLLIYLLTYNESRSGDLSTTLQEPADVDADWCCNCMLGYDCDANNPCTATNQGSYFPHVNSMKYIGCGSRCYEVQCAQSKLWDQNVGACVNHNPWIHNELLTIRRTDMICDYH